MMNLINKIFESSFKVVFTKNKNDLKKQVFYSLLRKKFEDSGYLKWKGFQKDIGTHYIAL